MTRMSFRTPLFMLALLGLMGVATELQPATPCSKAARGTCFVGVASWYGPGFHGRKTANGEKFNKNALTAAHNFLPLNSKVRVVNIATGLATTEPELEDVLKALGASKLDILWNVGLPRTMPFFFASLKVAISYAFVGAVLSETVASNRGIGNVMMTASSNFNVPLVFAGLFVLAGLGVALYVIFSLIEGRITGWATRKNDMIAT